jgi:hypothetical protein
MSLLADVDAESRSSDTVGTVRVLPQPAPQLEQA